MRSRAEILAAKREAEAKQQGEAGITAGMVTGITAGMKEEAKNEEKEKEEEGRKEEVKNENENENVENNENENENEEEEEEEEEDDPDGDGWWSGLMCRNGRADADYEGIMRSGCLFEKGENTFQIFVPGMDDKYSFPILKDNEIVNVMKQLNIPLEIEEINSPKPAKIAEVLVQFMSVCSGIPSDEITSFDRDTAKKYSLDGYSTILVAINAFEPL